MPYPEKELEFPFVPDPAKRIPVICAGKILINDQISAEDCGVIKKQLEEKIYSLKKNLYSFDKKQEDVNNLIKDLSNTKTE
ncbi:hypothetical protein QF042_002034 [Pedobacter sp. W3I1]|nr:hypothetical protein [Pedobacter sp. W3I1]